MMSNAAKIHNYFNGPTKLFLDLCLTFLDISPNRSFRIKFHKKLTRFFSISRVL